MSDPAPLRPPPGRLTLIFGVVVAAGLLVGGLLPEDDVDGGPMVGVTAPEIVIEAFDGGRWTLSEHLAGQSGLTVVNFWASWCVPCRQEIPELSAFASDNPDVTVVGVAVNDESEAARRLAEELDPAYLMGVDATGRLRDLYPGFGIPATFVIDDRGVVRRQIERPVTADELTDLVR